MAAAIAGMKPENVDGHRPEQRPVPSTATRDSGRHAANNAYAANKEIHERNLKTEDPRTP